MDKIANCNEHKCDYFDETMELNCAYSDDNSLCVNDKKGSDHWQAEAELKTDMYNQLQVEANDLLGRIANQYEKLVTMTALAEKYKGERDDLIEAVKMVINNVDDQQYPATINAMRFALKRIREEDK